jgi:hypothetical protein
MKKRLSFFLLLFYCLSAWSADFNNNGLNYNITSSVSPYTVEFTSGSIYNGNIEIPSVVINSGIAYSVTTIGNNAFYDCTGLTSITIPNSVTTIGNNAFYDCTGLTSITIPNSVTTIRTQAFFYCTRLTSITIPNSVTTIDNSAFMGCNGLTSITIPNSVTTIGTWAFSNTPWFNNKPDGMVYVGKVAYTYKGIMPSFTSLTLLDGTSSIADQAFFDCKGLTSITIPNSVTTIGVEAFYNCKGLTSITIPNSVTTIGESAFRDCNGLTSITIPNSVTTIGESAFTHCNGLTSITIPNSVNSIGDQAFYIAYDTIKSIISSVYNNKIFYKNPANLQSITLTRDIITDQLNYSYRTLKYADIAGVKNKELVPEMFYNCYVLDTLILPSNLEKITYRSISDCVSLKQIKIPATVTEIDMRAFENCRSLKKVNFETGSQLKTIGNWAFYACHALDSLIIPKGVTNIGDGAFWSCDYLKSISIPSSVVAIGDNAFDGCKSVSTIQVDALNPPMVSGKTFNQVSKSIPVKVPKGSLSSYKIAYGWKDFAFLSDTETEKQSDNPNLNFYVENGKVIVTGASPGELFELYNLQGKLLQSCITNSETMQVPLTKHDLYLVKVGGRSEKVVY